MRFTQSQWMKFTMKDWEKRFKKLKIGNPAKAGNRVIGKMLLTDKGNFTKFRFTFPFYLKFVAWGVGKGVDIFDVKFVTAARSIEGRGGRKTRRPKRWFRKKFIFNVIRLNELMAQKYAQKAVFEIVNTLEK